MSQGHIVLVFKANVPIPASGNLIRVSANGQARKVFFVIGLKVGLCTHTFRYKGRITVGQFPHKSTDADYKGQSFSVGKYAVTVTKRHVYDVHLVNDSLQLCDKGWIWPLFLNEMCPVSTK